MSVRTRASLILVLLQLIVVARAYSQDYRDFVVKIVADVDRGQVSQGTGFFFSNTHTVVTAYHVVINASHIRIYYHGDRYDDVLVARVSGGYDLAVLTIIGPVRIGAALPAFEPADTSRGSKLNVRAVLDIFGFPRDAPSGQPYYLPGNFNTDKPVSSLTFATFSENGKSQNLFNVDIPVLPVGCVMYGGVSGAPVIYNNRPIGVISGSYNVGGSISWAIPLYFIVGDQMRVLNRSAEQLSKTHGWPPLTLLNAAYFRSFSLVTDLPPRVTWTFHALAHIAAYNEDLGGSPQLAGDQSFAVSATATPILGRLFPFLQLSLEAGIPFSYYTLHYETFPGLYLDAANNWNLSPYAAAILDWHPIRRLHNVVDPYLGIGLGWTLVNADIYQKEHSIAWLPGPFASFHVGAVVLNAFRLDARLQVDREPTTSVGFNQFGTATVGTNNNYHLRIFVGGGTK